MLKQINLQDGKRIIEELEKIENNESNIFEVLNVIYKDYDVHAITNFLLQLRIKDNHYYLFIEDELKKIKELDKFNVNISNNVIKLRHKKSDKHLTMDGESVILNFINKKYDINKINEAEDRYRKYIKNHEVCVKERTKYDDLMDAVGEYLDKPSLMKKINIAKLSSKKSAISNFLTSKEIMSKLYTRYIEYKEDELENIRYKKTETEEMTTWLNTVFKEILHDVEELIIYLKSIGYTEE